MQQENHSITKPLGLWAAGSAFVVMLVGAVSVYSFSRLQANRQDVLTSPSQSSPAVIAVTALGRLEPEGEIIRLAAPTSLRDARVQQLLVKQGDEVQPQQVIALLDTHNLRLVALEQAEQQVDIAQSRLAQVQAGAKTGDVGAQRATIARLEAELSNANREFERNQALYADGAISASLLDSKRLVMETAQQQVDQAKATLVSVMEVRPVDVRVAQAEVNSAIASVKQSQEELEQTYIRSPKKARVLKVYAKPGEVIGNEGIIEIGQTNQMYAVAEVYETDIGKVRLGQKAFISSPAFADKLQGTITEIGWQIDKQSVFNTDTTADTDRKIIEVKIRINNSEDSRKVAGMTNLQVEVAIPLKP